MGWFPLDDKNRGSSACRIGYRKGTLCGGVAAGPPARIGGLQQPSACWLTARDGYLGLIDDDWESHQSEASQTAIHLKQRVMERLQ
jgi:hypothetical protein